MIDSPAVAEALQEHHSRQRGARRKRLIWTLGILGLIIVVAVTVWKNESAKPKPTELADHLTLAAMKDLSVYYASQAALYDHTVSTNVPREDILTIILPFDPLSVSGESASDHALHLLEFTGINERLTEPGRLSALSDIESEILEVAKLRRETPPLSVDAADRERYEADPRMTKASDGRYLGYATFDALSFSSFTWPGTDLVLIHVDSGYSGTYASQVIMRTEGINVIALIDPNTGKYEAINALTPDQAREVRDNPLNAANYGMPRP